MTIYDLPGVKGAAQKIGRRGFLVGGASALAACQLDVGGGGPLVNTSAPVPVGLLIPFGTETASNDVVATALQNAAQMAVTDLDGVQVDLLVHNTGATGEGAADAARAAVGAGAKILLGPVFADAANAAGKAVAASNVSVLSFSNNTSIAGGNVYVLGHTFENTARRILRFAASRGKERVLVVHARNLSGEIGRKAVEAAAADAGISYMGAGSYEFSQQGVVNAVRPIADQIKDTDTDLLVFASDTAGALPILTQLLPENGVDREKVQFAGLTRWDIPPSTLALDGVQGGWFAMPDPALAGAFRERYVTAYGQAPHPLAGLAYDGIAAVGALVKSGQANAFSKENLTQTSGFAGVNGVFRLLPDGTNERSLAIAQISDKQVSTIDPAPRRFAGTGL